MVNVELVASARVVVVAVVGFVGEPTESSYVTYTLIPSECTTCIFQCSCLCVYLCVRARARARVCAWARACVSVNNVLPGII